jgi:hypothetical protein
VTGTKSSANVAGLPQLPLPQRPRDLVGLSLHTFDVLGQPLQTMTYPVKDEYAELVKAGKHKASAIRAAMNVSLADKGHPRAIIEAKNGVFWIADLDITESYSWNGERVPYDNPRSHGVRLHPALVAVATGHFAFTPTKKDPTLLVRNRSFDRAAGEAKAGIVDDDTLAKQSPVAQPPAASTPSASRPAAEPMQPTEPVDRTPVPALQPSPKNIPAPVEQTAEPRRSVFPVVGASLGAGLVAGSASAYFGHVPAGRAAGIGVATGAVALVGGLILLS